jgi:hypothetical protein
MTNDIKRRLLNLVSDPNFVWFSNVTDEPNIFKIVGRTHTERWHSNFWGWLLDPNGSHSLNDYIINRLLLALLDDRCVKPISDVQKRLSDILSTVKFFNVKVKPNEYDNREKNKSNVGRFDIYVKGDIEEVDSNSPLLNINIIIEMKISTKTRANQSKKYADSLMKSYPNDFNLLIYILPTQQLGSTPEATVGDERWFCLDYQLLHDKVLLPTLDHPNLNEKVRQFIIQYVKNLRIPYKGLKMAITDEEKRIAKTLHDKYESEFDAIYEALQANGIEKYEDYQELTKASSRSSGRIAVKIGGNEFEGNSVADLFANVLKYIVDNGEVEKLVFPVEGSGRSRYIMSNEADPTHPNGKSFFYPVSYEGYTLEAHMSRNRSIKVLDDLCKELELKFELVEV